MSFSNFKSAAPVSAILPAGSHVVNIIRTAIVNSFMSFDRAKKEYVEDGDKYAWNSPTNQLLLELEDGQKRKATVRLNEMGYMKSDDISPEEFEERGLVDVDGFIGEQLPSGKIERIENPENTQVCHNILNKLFDSAGMPLGSSLDDFITKAAEEKITIGVKVVEEEFNGKMKRDVTAFFKPSEADLIVEKKQLQL